ncbi:MAG: extracellular solute-binding protein [Rhodospirillales bacterium]
MRVFAVIAGLAAGLVLALPPAPADAAEAKVTRAHGIAMHGDLKYPPDFKHLDYVDPNAPKGGTVKLGAIGSFDSLNPFIVKGNAATGIGGIYDSLTLDSADEAFSQYGLLAESIEVPADRSWVAFTLRPEARWHDGMPVTVEDVIYTFDLFVKKGTPFFRFYYGSVKEVVQTGPRTVRFNFKPGENRELPLIVGQLTVLPKHYWEKREFDKTTLEPPLGSGAYKVDKVDPGRSISYVRLPDYWAKDLPVKKGSDNFAAMQFDYYRDETIALEAFKAGAFDYRAENSSKNWATAYDIPAVKNGLLKKEEIHHDRSAGMQGFVYNTRRDVFKDRRVREALAYAFDFEWSNKNLFYGQYTRTRSYFDNSELAAKGLPGPEELKLLEPFRGKIPDEVFGKEYSPPKTDGSGNIRENLRAASRLLNDAGWVVKGQQRVDGKTGKPLTFEVLLVSPLFERIVLPFARNLEKLGIKIRVRTVDSAQYRRRLDTFDFDIIVGSFGQSLSPGNEQRSFWSSSSADLEGGRNFMGIKDPAIDALIEKLIAAPDRKSLIAATRALDRVLQWGFYLIPHFHAPYDRVAYWDMFGRPKVTPIRGNQFDAWWIDAEKQKALGRNRRADAK